MIGPRFKQQRLRDHAEEARVLADRMMDPVLQQQMLGIAEDFERYAVSAAELDRRVLEKRAPGRS